MRKTADILEAFLSLDYVAGGEPPVDNLQWSFLTYLAASLGRRVHDDLAPHLPSTFPNLYTILLGESAALRKSSTIHTVEHIFRKAYPNLRYGPTGLSASYLVKVLSDEEIADPGTVFFRSSELITFLGDPRKDDQLIKQLTDLWDCPSERTLGTRSRGEETVQNVCVNLLGGSTIEWMRDALPESSLGGGFWSRLILVNRPRRLNPVACPADLHTPETTELTHAIVHDLQTLSGLRGRFSWTPDAREDWILWYDEYSQPDDSEPPPPFMRGYFGRRGDMLRKLAMLLSCCRAGDLTITREDFHRANRILANNESYLENIITEMTLTKQGQDNRFFEETFKQLCANSEDGMVTQSEVTSKFKNRFKAVEIREHLATLASEGRLIQDTKDSPTGRKIKLYGYRGDK